jgi:hypothetical protein
MARKDAGLLPLTNVKGVKGISSLAFIPHFDIGSNFAPEYMHSCLLGVVKRHLLYILDSKKKDELYYIGLFEKNANNYLKQIKAPSFIRRLPRDLSTVKYWKASEFRNWLLYYSLPCLELIWKDAKFLQHYSLLVYAIHTLLKSEIKVNEITSAENALKLFCLKYSDLFGKFQMTYNLHMLLHYSKAVILFGPLFAHSAFVFENENGILKESIHGTGNIAVELINTAKIINSIRGFEIACQPKDFYKLKKCPTVLGAGEDILKIPTEVVEFVSGLPLCDNTLNIKYFLRMRLNGVVYTTENYSRCLKTCSYYMSYRISSASSLKAVKALYFCNIDDGSSIIFVGKKVILQEPRYTNDNVTVKHILKYEETNELVWGLTSFINGPLICINVVVGGKSIKVMCIPPNLVEINL